MDPRSPRRGRTLAVVGTALQIALMVGLIGAFSGAANSLDVLIVGGLGDLSTLWPALVEIPEPIAAGLAIGSVGLVLLAVALVKSRYRAPWLFWFLVVYAALLLPVFPLGTAFGAFFLVYCLTRREEFAAPVAG